jgi:uncharacterized membrane protein YdjX (TVP38/TMEM64 family)
LVIAVLCAAAAVLPLGSNLSSFLHWMRGLGYWAPLLLIVAYVAASLLFIPGLLLSIGAGFLFGVVAGTLTVSIGSVLGATAAFVVGRTLLRSSVEQMIASKPTFAALDRAVGRDGFKIVLLARLSPVLPYNLLNYALGLTPVRLVDFVLASWIGMLPATTVYVYFGSTLANLAELDGSTATTGTAQRVLYVLGLVATVFVAVYLTRLARRAWRGALDESSPGEAIS